MVRHSGMDAGFQRPRMVNLKRRQAFCNDGVLVNIKITGSSLFPRQPSYCSQRRLLMKFVNFLFHIYQPPVQEFDMLAKIVRESYEPLTRKIREASGLKFTLNINYSLVELLHDPFPQILENIRAAHDEGILELTETGAYHPIFPLIPYEEVERQIRLNHEGNQRLLTAEFNPQGVFSPELAFTGNLASQLKSLGYQWTIADDGNLDYYGIEVPFDTVYCQDELGVLLRSNHWSNRFANNDNNWVHGQEFVEELLASMKQWMGDQDGYLIIALDGETFGHHQHKYSEVFLSEMFAAFDQHKDEIRTAHLAEIFHHFKQVTQFIPPGSWSTDRADIDNRDYFSWWKSHKNPIHTLQWQFCDLVLDNVRRLNDKNLNGDMDKALYSCQFWWANYWKFDKPENSQEIYKGAFNLMRILQKAWVMTGNDDDIGKGEKLFRELVTAIENKRHLLENR